MDMVLRGLDGVFVCIDDILVPSQALEMHRVHLQALFDWLKENTLLIRPEKCRFSCSEFDLLGHRLHTAGICPLPSHVSAISNFSIPRTMHQLRQFLGLVNFYHCFIHHAATLLMPLHSLCSPRSPADIVNWTNDHKPVLSMLDNLSLLQLSWLIQILQRSCASSQMHLILVSGLFWSVALRVDVPFPVSLCIFHLLEYVIVPSTGNF